MAKIAWALVHQDADAFGISFPDFPGVVSGGDSVEEAIARGRDTLAFHIAGMIEDTDPLPALRSISQLRRDKGFTREARKFREVCVVDVPVDLPGKAVRVNISIEETLLDAIDRAADRCGQTRSAFLGEAARSRLSQTG